MLPAAEERIPALTSGEEIFSLAAGVDLAALDTHQGAREAQGKKPHQRDFSTNRILRVGKIWAKWSGTHQDRKCSWLETVSGSALDANGNTLADAKGRSFTWDFENRLIQVVNPSVGTTSFKYDPMGRRIQKAGPLGIMNYLYDGLDLIQELDATANDLASYAQGSGLDQPLATLRAGATFFYEEDGLPSVTSLSDSNGGLGETYGYDSFGTPVASTGSVTNSFEYTGREFDSETELYNYRARYFDFSTGRFLSEDPVRFGAGFNFYRYAADSPVNFIDSLGLAAAPSMPPSSSPLPPGWQVYEGGGGEATGWLSGLAGALEFLPALAIGPNNPNLNPDAVTAATINQANQKAGRQCQRRNRSCPDCMPPAGTIVYVVDTSHFHIPFFGRHWHLLVRSQNPNNCQCFWQRIGAGDGPPPANAQPLDPKNTW